MGAGLGATAFLVGFGGRGRGGGGGGGGVGATPISPVPVITRFSPDGAAGAAPNRVEMVLSPAKPLTKNWRLTPSWSATSLAGRLKRSSVTAPSMTAGPVVCIIGIRAVNNVPRASSVICT